MKVTICNVTRGDNPEIHKAGCRDIKTGLTKHRLTDPWDVEVASETAATLAYWDNGILAESYGYDGAQYADRDAATEAFRVNYMNFMPCTKDLPETAPATVPTSRNAARNDLARRVVLAVSYVFESADGSEAFLDSEYTKDEMAQIAANWLHALPTGDGPGAARWWGTETLPRPDRESWK